MPVGKLIFISFSALFCGIAAKVEADDSSPRSFEVSAQQENVPREHPPIRVFVTTDRNKFTFRTPDGFQARDDTAHQRMILTSVERNCVLTFRVLTPSSNADEENTKNWRALALARYPGAKIVSESSAIAAKRSGPVFDLQWNAHGLPQTSRIAFFIFNDTILEFSASGTDQVQYSFDTILMTFRVGPADEKMEIPPVSDQM